MKDPKGKHMQGEGSVKPQETLRESEESFRRAFDYASIGRAHASLDGRFHRVNRALCALTGYSHEELLEKTWQDLTHPDFLKRTFENRQKMLNDEVPSFEMELRANHKLGRELWVHLNVVLIKDADGRPLFISADIQDITDRKQAEDALRESEDSYRSIFDSANDAIFVHDTETGEILDVNTRMCEMFGYSREEVRRITVGDISSGVPPYTQADVLRWIKKAEAGKPQIFDWRARRRDGSLFWVEVSLRLVVLRGRSRLLAIVRDISDRKEAERVVTHERDRAQRYLDISGVIMVAIDAKQRVTLINRKGCDVLGYRSEEIVGKNWFDNFLPERERKATKAVYEKLIAGEVEPVEHYENLVMTKDGSERIISWHNTILTDENGTITGTLSSGEDITVLRRGIEALQESEERFRESFEQSVDPMLLIELATGTIVRFNRRAHESLGYTRDEFRNISLSDIDTLGDPGNILENIARIEKEGGYEFMTKHRRKNGELRDVLVHNTLIRYHDKTHLQCIWHDITERKRAEEELRSSREQLRELTTHLQLARENERAGIAREIHDELGQVLTVLKFDLSWLEGKLDRAPVLIREKVKSLLSLTDTTIQTVKRISTELRPRLLDDLGLIAAVEWQTEEFQQRTGIKCSVVVKPPEFSTNGKISTAIFRILQEALTNVTRHAGATAVEVILMREGKSFRLMVRDNGKGIEQSAVASRRSFGLVGMRERCHSLQGEIEITGNPRHGTTIEVFIPIPEEEGANDQDPHC